MSLQSGGLRNDRDGWVGLRRSVFERLDRRWHRERPWCPRRRCRGCRHPRLRPGNRRSLSGGTGATRDGWRTPAGVIGTSRRLRHARLCCRRLRTGLCRSCCGQARGCPYSRAAWRRRLGSGPRLRWRMSLRCIPTHRRRGCTGWWWWRRCRSWSLLLCRSGSRNLLNGRSSGVFLRLPSLLPEP